MYKFEMPRLTVTRFSAEDIITTSAGGNTPVTNGFTRGNDATGHTTTISEETISDKWSTAMNMDG